MTSSSSPREMIHTNDLLNKNFTISEDWVVIFNLCLLQNKMTTSSREYIQNTSNDVRPSFHYMIHKKALIIDDKHNVHIYLFTRNSTEEKYQRQYY